VRKISSGSQEKIGLNHVRERERREKLAAGKEVAAQTPRRKIEPSFATYRKWSWIDSSIK